LIFTPPDVKPGRVLRLSLYLLITSAVKILDFLDSHKRSFSNVPMRFGYGEYEWPDGAAELVREKDRFCAHANLSH
jgi:hypothetical protein